MITHIRMKNFKSWKDSGKVDLAPLTGFFGTNSSGKSSLLQMLLLLKQTVGSDKVLFFGDENSLVNLGSFSEVVHCHDRSVPLVFEFACKLTHARSNNIRENYLEMLKTAYQFAFESTIQEDNGRLSTEKLCYSYSHKTYPEIVCEDNKIFSRYNSEKGNPLVLENCYSMESPAETEVEKLLWKFSSAFEELFSHIYYLGPTRVKPQRHYPWKGTHPNEIDLWGDKTIDALLSAGVRKLKTSTKEDAAPIEDRISEWLQKMELAHSFRLIPTKSLDDQNYEVRTQKSPGSVEVTLADMGYGLADVLPMLVYCYYVQQGSTLILEQPGIHLHPKVQAQLADFLIEVINERKLQILVESHSEHLLTRLQRRIAEKQIPEKNVALYFCRNNDSASTIEKLDVDEASGDIKNWPENFFGDVMGDMFAMTDKQVESIAEKGTEG